MKPTNPRRMTAAELEALAKRDRNRILLFAVGAALLAVAFFGARMFRESAEESERAQAPVVPESPPPGSLVVPEFDQPELLEAVRDATPEERLTLASEALRALLLYANLLTPRHYAEDGAVDLDAARVAALSGAPAEARAEPHRARGWLESLGRRRLAERLEVSYGTLRLEDDARVHAYFLKPAEADDIAVGDFVAIEGLFVQNYRTEVDRELVDAPLIAGRTLVPSYPPCTAMDADELRAYLIAEVRDDELGDVEGEEPREPLWRLMALAAQRAEDMDWESAVELDAVTLDGIARGGDAFRGVPFRFPISTNMGSWTESAGENCLRLERVTRGWIGNFAWTGATPVVYWIGPFDAPVLADRYGASKLLNARGFFLRNVYYERANGSPGRAPLFVMASVDPFVPPVDRRPQMIMFGVLGGTLGTIALIWYLLLRDRRESRRLHDDLVRRKRARRKRQEGSDDERNLKAIESGTPGA